MKKSSTGLFILLLSISLLAVAYFHGTGETTAEFNTVPEITVRKIHRPRKTQMSKNMANSRWNKSWKKMLGALCAFCGLLFVSRNCFPGSKKDSSFIPVPRAPISDLRLSALVATVKQTPLAPDTKFKNQFTAEQLGQLPGFQGTGAILQVTQADTKPINKSFENLATSGNLPGQLFVKNCFNRSNKLKSQANLTIVEGTTVSSACVNAMAKDTELYINRSMPSGVTPIGPTSPISTLDDSQVTAGLILCAPTRVLIEPVAGKKGTYQLKAGALEMQRPVLVFGIAAISQGNDSVSMSCHKQMLKNMISLALAKGINKLTILPPGCGVFGVDKEVMIILMSEVLAELQANGADLSNFVIYLNAIGAEEFAKQAFAQKGLQDNLCVSPRADIVFLADALAQKDSQAPEAPPSVATVNLLNPDPIKGSGELAYGWTAVSLSAQRMSAVTTVETASQCRNRQIYRNPKPMPVLFGAPIGAPVEGPIALPLPSVVF